MSEIICGHPFPTFLLFFFFFSFFFFLLYFSFHLQSDPCTSRVAVTLSSSYPSSPDCCPPDEKP